MMSTRCESNHSFWLGRTLATAVMVLVGLGVFAGSAQAQNNEAVVLRDITAWWDHLNCQRMIDAVNAITDAADGDAHDAVTDHIILAGDEDDPPAGFPAQQNNATREWCSKWAGLGENQRRALDAAAKRPLGAKGIVTPTTGNRVFDITGWWSMLDNEGRQIAIGTDADAVAATLGGATEAVAGQIRAAYNALMGGMMTTDDEEEEAPALPLVGIGLLGLLLAGRGAWLRRRA